MKLVRWKKYIWDLSKLSDVEPQIPNHYNIRSAGKEEEKAIHNVIITAFGLDTAWGDSFKQISGFIESQITKSFLHRAVPCLVLTHGSRIIGASALNVSDDALCHLISGPCILAEYRSRGLGSALLYESLAHLKTAGIANAVGICKDNVPAGKFVYPKFGSRNEDVDFNVLKTAL